MDTALQTEFVSVVDYLEGEDNSHIRHEYVKGSVYAMAGSTKEHNLIAGNLYNAFRTSLRGGRCQVFMSDLRLHVVEGDGETFYYPDLVVTCDPRDTSRTFVRHPTAIIEVLSESTHRTDRIEKLNAYTRIDSVCEYMLVHQSRPEVILFRRAGGWKPEIFTSREDEISLPSLNFQTSLESIYAEVAL